MHFIQLIVNYCLKIFPTVQNCRSGISFLQATAHSGTSVDFCAVTRPSYNNFAFQILHCYCYYYDYFFVYSCLFNSSNDINMSNESKNVNMFGNLDRDKNIIFYRCRIRGTYEQRRFTYYFRLPPPCCFNHFIITYVGQSTCLHVCVFCLTVSGYVI